MQLLCRIWSMYLLDLIRPLTGILAKNKCPCLFYRGGSRISGKGVHMYKGVGFALLVLSLFPIYHLRIESYFFAFH